MGQGSVVLKIYNVNPTGSGMASVFALISFKSGRSQSFSELVCSQLTKELTAQRSDRVKVGEVRAYLTQASASFITGDTNARTINQQKRFLNLLNILAAPS